MQKRAISLLDKLMLLTVVAQRSMARHSDMVICDHDFVVQYVRRPMKAKKVIKERSEKVRCRVLNEKKLDHDTVVDYGALVRKTFARDSHTRVFLCKKLVK